MSRSGVLLLVVLAFALGWVTKPMPKDRDEIVRYDTIREPIPQPFIEGGTKFVIVPVNKPAKIPQNDERIAEVQDTTSNDLPVLKGDSIVIPIERRIYKTDNYRAVVEGWRPELVDMEVYETVIRQKPPRISVVAGVSYAFDGRRFTPAVGVTVGIPIWSK